jgi:hypothetical protein
MLARDLCTVGRTVEKAAVRWSRVMVSVVPAWPLGKAMNSTQTQYLLSSEGCDEGGVFLGLLVELTLAAEVLAKADLDDDEGAMFFVKRGRVGEGSVWDPSCIDEVRCSAMSGFEQHLGFSRWEDSIRYAAWCRGALCVSGGGGRRDPCGCIWDLGRRLCVAYCGQPPTWAGVRTSRTSGSP